MDVKYFSVGNVEWHVTIQPEIQTKIETHSIIQSKIGIDENSVENRDFRLNTISEYIRLSESVFSTEFSTESLCSTELSSESILSTELNALRFD